MSQFVKTGTARRLGMWVRPVPVPLATVSDGITTHTLAAVGSNARACYVDSRGRAASGPGVTVNAGMISDRRSVGGQIVGDWPDAARC